MALVGLTYAELVSAMPHAGGEHNYVLRGLGSRAAFVTSWSLVFGYISVVAFEAVALPQTMLFLAPDMLAGRLWTVAGYDVYATWVAVGVVGAVLITALNYVGVRPAAVFQAVAVLFLLAVGALLLVGSFVGGSTDNMQPLFAGGFGGIVAVLVAVPFLFVGFDVIPQSAGEINLPFRQIGKLVVVSVLAAAAFYMLVMVTVGLLPAPGRARRGHAARGGRDVRAVGQQDLREHPRRRRHRRDPHQLERFPAGCEPAAVRDGDLGDGAVLVREGAPAVPHAEQRGALHRRAVGALAALRPSDAGLAGRRRRHLDRRRVPAGDRDLPGPAPDRARDGAAVPRLPRQVGRGRRVRC